MSDEQTERDEDFAWFGEMIEERDAEVARLEQALARIEHYPFSVTSDAEADLRFVKEIARQARIAHARRA